MGCIKRSNPSLKNSLCKEYFTQRMRNPRLKKEKPHSRTVLMTENGKLVVCWEDPELNGGFFGKGSIQGNHGWCKVSNVKQFILLQEVFHLK